MKNDLLNRLLMISVIAPACNTTAANTLITKAHVEFQIKSAGKNRVVLEVSLKVNRWTRKFPYEEVPDLLLLEREADSAISSAEIEVSKSELATGLSFIGL